VKFKKETEDGTIYQEPYFASTAVTIINEDEIKQKLEVAEEEILERIAKCISEGSQWISDEILTHFINIVTYIPIRGNSYIPLPQELRNSKKGLINLQNGDNKCFLWCHVCHLNLAKHNPQRITTDDREFSKKLDYPGISFPVQIKDVGKIEKQNPSLLIFLVMKVKVYTLSKSQKKNIMIIRNFYIYKKKSISHYVIIKDFNRLMYNFSNHKETKHFCMYCLHCFSSKTS